MTTLKPTIRLKRTPKILSIDPSSIEFLLFIGGLEAAMAEFGRGVYKLQTDSLHCETRGLFEQRLPQCQHSLLRPHTATFYHQIVIIHYAIVRESSHWCYVFLSPAFYNLQY